MVRKSNNIKITLLPKICLFVRYVGDSRTLCLRKGYLIQTSVFFLAPFVFPNARGEITGKDVDLFKIVANKLELKFEITRETQDKVMMKKVCKYTYTHQLLNIVCLHNDYL